MLQDAFISSSVEALDLGAVDTAVGVEDVTGSF
jgi:hypothetical protein